MEERRPRGGYRSRCPKFRCGRHVPWRKYAQHLEFKNNIPEDPLRNEEFPIENVIENLEKIKNLSPEIIQRAIDEITRLHRYYRETSDETEYKVAKYASNTPRERIINGKRIMRKFMKTGVSRKPVTGDYFLNRCEDGELWVFRADRRFKMDRVFEIVEEISYEKNWYKLL